MSRINLTLQKLLNKAAHNGQPQVVGFLLKEGAVAAANNSESLYEAIDGKSVAVVKLLLDAGADANKGTWSGNTARKHAVRSGETAIVALFDA